MPDMAGQVHGLKKNTSKKMPVCPHTSSAERYLFLHIVGSNEKMPPHLVLAGGRVGYYKFNSEATLALLANTVKQVDLKATSSHPNNLWKEPSHNGQLNWSKSCMATTRLGRF